ncbi:MAG TPA: tetratricopeptide repeat protein [Candidatus Aminicenantes bacterium]|nr:tetratricopeptide repeat protein [Candidatus Aminicenantes bacterium]
MKQPTALSARRPAVTAALALALALPALAQYREYHISGKVVDSRKNALAGVAILLRDQATSRSYSIKTKADGTFKFVGLPHGVYAVVFKKDGFAEKTDEWRFEQPQDQMFRVEVPPVTMVSTEVLAEAEAMKRAEAGVRAAAEKVRSGEYDAAIAALGPLIAKNPRDSNALYILGMAHQKKAQWPEAIAAFLEVREIVPSFAAAHYQLGVCYQQTGEPDKALAAYAEAMRLDPANPDSPYNSGLILFGRSQASEALAFFEKALALRPDDPAFLEMAARCHINLAAARKPDGTIEADKAAFEKALGYLEKARAGYAADPGKVKFIGELIALVKEELKK